MGLRKKETLMTNYTALSEYTAYSEQARDAADAASLI